MKIYKKSLKKLIINADDFGISEGINQGIIKTFRNGTVNRISFFPNPDLFARSLKLLKQNNINKIGVHLAVVGSEKPLTENKNKIKSLLTSEGLFYNRYYDVIRLYLLRKIKPKEIETEFESQIKKVLQSGLIISHLDTHQHLHLLPSIRDIVLKLALKYNIQYIRCPYSEKQSLKSKLINLLSFSLRKEIKKRGLTTSDYFKGFDYSGHLNKENLSSILGSLKEGLAELMVHPGVDEAILSKDKPGFNRETEFETLLDPMIKREILKYNSSR